MTTEPQRVYTDENGEFVPLFVIPQILMSTDYESEDWTVGQQLVMDLTIVTHLPGNPDDSGKPLVITENIHKVYDLKDISPLKAWEMNQDITYTINIKPTASSDPGNPDDPKDVIITFDPAVDDWVVLPETPKDVIIMPQILVNKIVPAEGETAPAFQALKVTYNIVTYFNGKDNPVTESNVVSTVPFYYAGQAAQEADNTVDPPIPAVPAIPAITEFKKNQKIVYTVTIFPYANNPILFDPAVVAWDETTGTLDLVNAD